MGGFKTVLERQHLQSMEQERPKLINTTGHLFLTETKLMDCNNAQIDLESSSFTAKTLFCELWGKGKLAWQAEEYLLAVFSQFCPAISLLPWHEDMKMSVLPLYHPFVIFSGFLSCTYFSLLYSVIPHPITETINIQNHTKKLHSDNNKGKQFSVLRAGPTCISSYANQNLRGN